MREKKLMKMFALTTASAMLLAGSAFAQGTGNLGAQQDMNKGTGAPSFQQGSGHRAGGPAAELNSPTGAPATTGTVMPADPQASGGAMPAGKGHSAGGPLGEQMRKQGVGQ
jgi:hypothetical protein